LRELPRARDAGYQSPCINLGRIPCQAGGNNWGLRRQKRRGARLRAVSFL